MIPDAVLHLVVFPDFAREYVERGECRATIVDHGRLPRPLVPLYIGGMDLTLYVSFHEAFP
jgi:hypothetical protein